MDQRSQPRAERRRLSHVDRSGRPRMVDVSDKPVTARRAIAEALVAVSPETMSMVIDAAAQEVREKTRALPVQKRKRRVSTLLGGLISLLRAVNTITLSVAATSTPTPNAHSNSVPRIRFS